MNQRRDSRVTITHCILECIVSHESLAVGSLAQKG